MKSHGRWSVGGVVIILFLNFKNTYTTNNLTYRNLKRDTTNYYSDSKKQKKKKDTKPKNIKTWTLSKKDT